MKPTLFLRAASVLTLIHAILHTVGGVFGEPMPGVAAMVAKTMQDNRFPVLGVTRSYSDFYFGMGVGITISLTVEAALLWQLGALAKSDAARLRPFIAVLMVGFLGFSVNSYLYFFYGPVLAELLIAVCLAFAITTAKPESALSEAATPARA